MRNWQEKLMKDLNKLMQKVVMIGQLGLSFIMPTLIMVLLCGWLCESKGWPLWIYIPGFILGLGSSFLTAYKFYKAIVDKEDKDSKGKKTKVYFNNH